ncbi:MAG: hypothetical protein HY841_11710 [Bacteroidetes bacterium]|nr:hypothetical protein [Bacteroidota bacterium]
MQTSNQKQPNRKSPAEQVVFIEYSSAEKGQHFMTVMGKENGRRKIEARIFRAFDPAEKKMKYTAKDREDKEIFPSDFNLYALKKKFIDKAKEKARMITQSLSETPMTGGEEPEKDKVIETMKRESEVQEIRNGKTKSKGQELSR